MDDSAWAGAIGRLEIRDSLLIGVDEIDADHRALAATINRIFVALDAGSDSFLDLFDELVALAHNHFQREEEVLARHGYPRLDAHRVYHQELMNRARALRQSCLAAPDTSARTCFESLVDFIIDDIIRGDLEFKSFLVERGVAQE